MAGIVNGFAVTVSFVNDDVQPTKRYPASAVAVATTDLEDAITLRAPAAAPSTVVATLPPVVADTSTTFIPAAGTCRATRNAKM